MLRRLGLLIALGLLSSILPAAGQAQDTDPPPTISSDRPGLGDGTHVLPAGAWQLETGVQFLDAAGPLDRFSFGQGLVRGGFEAFEVRFYLNSLVLQEGVTDSDMGFEDIGLGVKVPLGATSGWNWASTAMVTLPVGGAGFTQDVVTAGAALVGETSLGGSVALAVNLGYAFPFEDPEDGALALIVTPGFPISSVDGLSGYAGLASYIGSGDDVNIIEAGLAYLTGPLTQVDLNWGIDTDTREWFIGVGWARRW